MSTGSKREKRIARQSAEQEAFQKKKLRQLENPNSFKRVSEAEPISTAKSVREAQRPADMVMSWTRDQADTDGDWTWGPRACLNDAWDDEIEPFLRECARKTWNEIYQERTGGASRRQKHIFYGIDQICDEAQCRLLELERDDVDCVFRFRLTGPKRLYGVQQDHVFAVLWWDPEHKIYPVVVD